MIPVVLLITLLLSSCQSVVLFTRSNVFGAFHLHLHNRGSMIDAQNNKRFQLINIYNYQNMKVIGVALNGYKMPDPTRILFTTEPTYSFDTNKVIITVLNDPGSSFQIIKYSVLVVSSSYENVVDIQNVCFTPRLTAIQTQSLNYQQRFNFSTSINRTTGEQVAIMPFIRSYKSVALRGRNTLNLTKFQFVGSNNLISFELIVSDSVIQQFCLSTVIIHYTNLRRFPTLNASHVNGLILDSSKSTQTLQVAVQNTFGMSHIYGPIYDQKCVIGLTKIEIRTGAAAQLLFNLSTNPISEVSANSTYFSQYSSFCFVALQCQFLFQQYYPLINDCQNTCTLSNCIQCTTASSCKSCEPGYFVSSMLRCVKCIDRCTTCFSTLTCHECDPLFYYNSTSMSCLPCQSNCLRCTLATCERCVTGFFSDRTECKSCESLMPGCTVCEGSRACKSCRTGFHFALSQTGCISCAVSINNCNTCDSGTRCLVCINGFYLQNPRICTICSFQIPLCCGQMIANCARCSSRSTCVTCATGFFFPLNNNLNNTCLSCLQLINNCSECVSNSNCTKCQTGFYNMNTSCVSCGSAITNCLECFSGTLCSLCANSNVVVNGICQPCGDEKTREYFYVNNNRCTMCSIGIEYCERCTSNTNCLQCQSGFYVNRGKCVACGAVLESCIVCDGATTCLACNAGYFLQDNKCIQCQMQVQGCSLCLIQSGNVTCLRCSLQYYMRTDGTCATCISAIARCEQCTNQTSCILCIAGYYLSAGICSQCMVDNCIICSSPQVCTTCSNGYFPNQTNTCQTCSSVLKFCSLCKNSTWCSQCQSSYYLGLDARCYSCFTKIDNCITCRNGDICQTCLTGYFLSLNQTSCLRCNPRFTNCLTCVDFTACSVCQATYHLSPNGTCQTCKLLIPGCNNCLVPTICLQCQTGRYLSDLAPNSSQLNITNRCLFCEQAISNCLRCNNGSSCLQCKPKYFPLNARCSLCNIYLTKCIRCDNSVTCLQCEQGFLPSRGRCTACTPLLPHCMTCAQVDSPYLCGKCKEGYYVGSGQTCISCSSQIENCHTCNSPSLCLDCQDGFYAALNNQKCLPCLFECAKCSTFSECQYCSGGYYLDETSTCTACSSNCDNCNSSSICYDCAPGFFLNSQLQCASCSLVQSDCLVCTNGTACTVSRAASKPNQQGSPWAYIAFAAGGVLLLLLLILLLCCLYRCFWNAPQPQSSRAAGSVVGITDRQVLMKGQSGEKQFQVEHDGKCRMCHKNKLQIMNIQLVCLQCERSGREDMRLSHLTAPIRKEIVFSKTSLDDDRITQ